MSDIISDWQTALVDTLSQSPPNGLGFPFLPMRRDGLSREGDVGCVFPGKPAFEATDSGRSAFANYRMTIRAWRRFRGEPSQNRQSDPRPVNELEAALKELLQPLQTTLLDGMYFRVLQTECDYPELGVEVQLLGWAKNAAALAL